MVCPHCGTLNPDERSACFRCEHSLAPARVAAEGVCHFHPTVASVANCTVCDTPICEACDVRVGDVSYCPNCAGVPGVGVGNDSAVRALTQSELETYPCASLGWRMAAGVMDGFILGAGAVALAFVFWMAFGVPPGVPWGGGMNLVFYLLLFIGMGGYTIGYFVSGGETPGYGAADLMLIQRDGMAVTPLTATVRYLTSYLSIACFGLGMLWMLWDPDSQTWHDKVAGTLVLRTSERNDAPDDTPLPL